MTPYTSFISCPNTKKIIYVSAISCLTFFFARLFIGFWIVPFERREKDLLGPNEIMRGQIGYTILSS